MSFAFDTGSPEAQIKSAAVDQTQRIRFTSWTRADRAKRQIIEAIEAMERPEDVEAHVAAEDLMIDALHLYDPTMAADIRVAAAEHRAALIHGANPYARATAHPSPAAPGSPNGQAADAAANTAKKEAKMSFEIDTGGSGSEGPWIVWSARGTQDGAVPPQSFFIRDENGKTATDVFTKGVVLDVVNMRTGWQRSDGIVGQAPEWKWNASIAKMEPQPGDDYKRGFQIRCAIGGGKTATWEQAGAGAWNAFTGLVPALQAGPGDGSLPMVRLAGVKVEKFARGQTATPVLEIVKWVPRPDCLKEGTNIATEAPTAPPPPPAPAAQPQTAQPAMADDDIGF